MPGRCRSAATSATGVAGRASRFRAANPADALHGALQAGAAVYLVKDAEADEVAAAIRAARRGEVHLDPAVAKQLTQSVVTPGHNPRPR